MEARARLIQQVSVTAYATGIYDAVATRTTRTGIRPFLRVTPTEPQELVWLHPGTPIAYTVASNSRWLLT